MTARRESFPRAIRRARRERPRIWSTRAACRAHRRGDRMSTDARLTTTVLSRPPGGQAMSLLATEKLVKAYRKRRVVNGVSIQVNPGQIVGLLGPNGAGKTTTFNMVVGVIRPDDGAVKFREKNVTRWPMHRRARLGMGYLTQEPSVFRKLTVQQNILAILETCRISRHE